MLLFNWWPRLAWNQLLGPLGTTILRNLGKTPRMNLTYGGKGSSSLIGLASHAGQWTRIVLVRASSSIHGSKAVLQHGLSLCSCFLVTWSNRPCSGHSLCGADLARYHTLNLDRKQPELRSHIWLLHDPMGFQDSVAVRTTRQPAFPFPLEASLEDVLPYVNLVRASDRISSQSF